MAGVAISICIQVDLLKIKARNITSLLALLPYEQGLHG